MSATSSEGESSYLDQIIYQKAGQQGNSGEEPNPTASSRNLLGKEGVGPVASSLDDKKLRYWDDKLQILVQSEGHPYSSLCYLTGHERAVLLYRAIDESDRHSSFAHVLIGSHDVLTPKRALGSWPWTWSGAKKPGEPIESGQLLPIEATKFIRDADAGWDALCKDERATPGLLYLINALFGPRAITPDLGDSSFAVIIEESHDYSPILLLSRIIVRLGSSAFIKTGFSTHEPEYDDSQQRLPRFVFATKRQVKPSHSTSRLTVKLDADAVSHDDDVEPRVLSKIKDYKELSSKQRDEQEEVPHADTGLPVVRKYGIELADTESGQDRLPTTSAEDDLATVTSVRPDGHGTTPELDQVTLLYDYRQSASAPVSTSNAAVSTTHAPVPPPGAAEEATVTPEASAAGTTRDHDWGRHARTDGGQYGAPAASPGPATPVIESTPPGGPTGGPDDWFRRPQISPQPPAQWGPSTSAPAEDARKSDLDLIQRLRDVKESDVRILIADFQKRIHESPQRPIDYNGVQDLLIEHNFWGRYLRGLETEEGPGELYGVVANFAFSSIDPGLPDRGRIVDIINDVQAPQLLIRKILAIIWPDKKAPREFAQIVGAKRLADLGITLRSPEPVPAPVPHSTPGLSGEVSFFAAAAVAFLIVLFLLLILGGLS